jgi:hypothetical protein
LCLLFPIYGKIKHVPNHQPDGDDGQINGDDVQQLIIMVNYGQIMVVMIKQKKHVIMIMVNYGQFWKTIMNN